VRGDLVAPAIDWLGQLVAMRDRSLESLDGLLTKSERNLLCDPPTAERWVPVATAQRLVEAIVSVHGGRMPAVLRELGRRSVPRIEWLNDAPVDRIAIRLDRLIQLGHWRSPRLCLPGDLLELEAHHRCAPSLIAWISGLLAVACPRGQHGGTHVAARIESPRHVVFVRCAA
jgi:hypothetical protein